MTPTSPNPKGNHDKLVTFSYQLLSKDGRTIASGERIQRAPDNAKSGNNADAIFLLSPDEVQKVTRLRLSITAKAY